MTVYGQLKNTCGQILYSLMYHCLPRTEDLVDYFLFDLRKGYWRLLFISIRGALAGSGSTGRFVIGDVTHCYSND